jgi:nucleoside-diphosphate-sugar epimerase
MNSIAELEDRLSTPSAALAADLARLDGDILILGAGGKLGPSLTRLALRGAGGRRVTVVSRFGKGTLADELGRAGAEVLPADITDDGVLARLPDAANVIFLVGSKFGSTGNEAGTWYTNTYLPGRVAERFRASRIVALSTGNVYPFTPVGSGGPDESVPPGPVGEYAMSCLGRERIFSHFAHVHGTKLALIRLNYAVEMRYGVLVDIARAVHAGQPVDVTMAAVNVVWQGYANEVILRALLHASPEPFVLNLAGPETLSVRSLAQAFGRAMGKPVEIAGSEAASALLSNAGLCHRLFGYPDVAVGELIEWTARWIEAGLPLLDKPTGFQKRDGKF